MHAGYTTRGTRRNLKSRSTHFAPVLASAGAVLGALAPDTERVYVVGDAPAAGWLAWAHADLPPGWSGGRHSLDSRAPILRYQYAAPEQSIPGPRRVEVAPASSWFGGGDYTPRDATLAWLALGTMIGHAFPGSTLLTTPATTGRELFARSIPSGREYPCPSRDIAELIRSTAGGGRIEVITPSAWPTALPALYEYDGRLFYAALVRELASGEPDWIAWDERRHEYDEYARARYRVSLTVPPDWVHPFGLVGVKHEGGGWRYPSKPRESFETWCDGAELRVAAKAGWAFTIHEALVWQRESGRGPLDSWGAKLLDLARVAQGEPDIGELLYSAVRNIALHTIGSFHSATRVVTRSLPLDRATEVPGDAVDVRVEDGHVVWGEEAPASSWSESMRHPEWSAAVWARGRARLLDGPGSTGALHARGYVVAFRTDALALTERQSWTDSGRPGQLRLKTIVPAEGGPYEWPRNGLEYVALRDGKGVRA